MDGQTQTQQPQTQKRTARGLATAAVTTVMVCAGEAQAAIDTSGVEGLFDDATTAAGVIGAAGLLLAVGIAIYKRIRGAA